MADAHSFNEHRVKPVLLALCALLTAIYLATGAGRFRIIDEVSLFAVTESVAKRGALDTNAIAWTQWVNSPGEVLGAFGPEGDVFSKKGPAPAFIAVPFYLIGWLSGMLPVASLRLSALQTALWANGFVTALTALLLAQNVRILGYRLRTALLAGMLFGLATIAWPYATHFFGEPLSTLAISGLFYALLRLRQTGEARYAIWGGIAAGVMIATSAAHAVLLAPFGLYLLWGMTKRRRDEAAKQRISNSPIRPSGHSLICLSLFALPLLCVAGLLMWYNWARFGALFSTGYHFEAGEGFTANWREGLWGVLFSPYRGWFWYSPLALAGVIAWPGFLRRHQAEGRLLLAITLILVGLFGKWWMWWGGFAWGPRFLVPLAPIFVLVLAPWLDRPHRRRTWAAFGLLAGLSVIVQLLAVSVNYANYEFILRQIYPTDWADPLKYGPPALYNPVHSPVLGQIRLLLDNPTTNLDLGWLEPGRIAWRVPAVAGLTGLLAGSTWRLAARRRNRPAWASAALALLAALGTAGLSAQAYAAQADYGADDQGYGTAMAEIARRGRPGDGIVTIAPYHYHITMARYRDRLPIYGYATEPTPLHRETEAVLRRALTRHQRLWLVTVGLPPADPSNGVEAWLATHAFVAEDRWLDDARLVVFITAEELTPADAVARLDNQVELLAARVGAANARPGGTLAVELTWQATASWQGKPLRGFVQLLTPDGRLAVGQDGPPGGGYKASSGWTPGVPVADRRGLLLPENLPAGEYALIAGLYDETTGQRLKVSNGSEGSAADYILLDAIQLSLLP